MKTTIDNNQRIFLVQSQGMGGTRDVFCNLKDLPGAIADVVADRGDAKILHYWNRKFTRCSKKLLNDMFKAHEITFRVK